MKTLLFCTCYLEHSDRYFSWIDYYIKNRKKIGADHLGLLDDGSPNFSLLKEAARLFDSETLPDQLKAKTFAVTFRQHFGRRGIYFPGWWRNFTFSAILAKKYGFKKLIHIESDFYVLSPRLFNYLREVKSGWIGFWSPSFQFPESGIQVICEDQIQSLEKFYSKGKDFFFSNEKFPEKILPFTHVEKSFIGDRFGDQRVFDFHSGIPNDLDYAGQVWNFS